jgi:hypothetical protein
MGAKFYRGADKPKKSERGFTKLDLGSELLSGLL